MRALGDSLFMRLHPLQDDRAATASINEVFTSTFNKGTTRVLKMDIEPAGWSRAVVRLERATLWKRFPACDRMIVTFVQFDRTKEEFTYKRPLGDKIASYLQRSIIFAAQDGSFDGSEVIIKLQLESDTAPLETIKTWPKSQLLLRYNRQSRSLGAVKERYQLLFPSSISASHSDYGQEWIDCKGELGRYLRTSSHRRSSHETSPPLSLRFMPLQPSPSRSNPSDVDAIQHDAVLSPSSKRSSAEDLSHTVESRRRELEKLRQKDDEEEKLLAEFEAQEKEFKTLKDRKDRRAIRKQAAAAESSSVRGYEDERAGRSASTASVQQESTAPSESQRPPSQTSPHRAEAESAPLHRQTLQQHQSHRERGIQGSVEGPFDSVTSAQSLGLRAVLCRSPPSAAVSSNAETADHQEQVYSSHCRGSKVTPAKRGEPEGHQKTARQSDVITRKLVSYDSSEEADDYETTDWATLYAIDSTAQKPRDDPDGSEKAVDSPHVKKRQRVEPVEDGPDNGSATMKIIKIEEK